MLFEVVMAGFGGQGILYMGDLLAEAALNEGRNVTFLPTYGVAMRGGTANCVVTVSDAEIGSPLLDHPHAAVVMNQQSLRKFQSSVRPGGVIVANSTMIDPNALEVGGDIRMIWIPATEMARATVGNERSAKMVLLGAFLKAEPVVRVESIEALVSRGASGPKKDLIEKNVAAFRAGLAYDGS